MTSKYEIREYRPDDQDEVLSLIEKIWGQKNKNNLQDQWDWKFFKQNHLKDCCTSLYIILVKNKIIGLVGLMPSKMQVGNQIIFPVFGTDLGVHPKYRGAGVQLLRFLFTLPNIHLIGTPNERAYRLEKKMGFIDVAQYDDYVAVVNLRDFLLARKKSKLIAFVAGIVYRAAFAIISLRFDRIKSSELVCEKINSFDDRFDSLWKKVSPTYDDVINIRDRQFLEWRFKQIPNRDYMVLSAESENIIRGYIVISIKNRKAILRGRIVDFLVPKGDKKTLGFLMQHAMKELIKKKVTLIETSITSDQKWCEQVLKKNGFLIKNKGAHVDIFVKDKLKSEGLASKSWYLTFADSDLDFTE